MTYEILTEEKSEKIVGGNDYIWKCWDTSGNVYWDNAPNKAGCRKHGSGSLVKGSREQRGGGKK